MAQERPRGEILVTEQDLPTTLEIAKHGTEAFKKIAAALPSIRLKRIFTKDPNMKMCFAGTMPEYSIRNESLISALEDPAFLPSMEEMAPQMSIITDRAGPNGGHKHTSLVNLEAAERIIKIHQDKFPPSAQLDTKNWLRENFDLWNNQHGTMGLLSGIPPWDVELYSVWFTINAKFLVEIAKGSLDMSSPEMDFYGNYPSLREAERTPKAKSKVSSFMEEMALGFTPYQIEFVINAWTSESITGDHQRLSGIPTFVSFDPKRDRQYTKMLSSLYSQSGIEKTVNTSS